MDDNTRFSKKPRDLDYVWSLEKRLFIHAGHFFYNIKLFIGHLLIKACSQLLSPFILIIIPRGRCSDLITPLSQAKEVGTALPGTHGQWAKQAWNRQCLAATLAAWAVDFGGLCALAVSYNLTALYISDFPLLSATQSLFLLFPASLPVMSQAWEWGLENDHISLQITGTRLKTNWQDKYPCANSAAPNTADHNYGSLKEAELLGLHPGEPRPTSLAQSKCVGGSVHPFPGITF